MSTIPSTTPLGPVSPATDATTTTRAGALGKDAFLQLLVTQMSHQNPLQPQEDGAFIAQLAQFSSLEQLTSIDKTLASMAEVLGVDMTKIAAKTALKTTQA
jgi:flagellar basal-body rod modification protein FlgD